MAFDAQGFAHAGRRVVLAAEDLPPGAQFADQGDGTGHFAWTPAALDAGRYHMTIRGADEGGRSDFAWSDLEIRLANDDFDGAYVIAALPFRDEAATLTATRAIDDPSCDTYDATVWYAFTPPTDLILVGSTAGSDYRTTLSAYVGTHPIPDPLLCAYGDLVIEAHAGVTYYLMVNGREGGGRLEFSLVGFPPLEVGVAIDSRARLDPRTGDFTVGGTVTCTRPVPVALDLMLAQSKGESPTRVRAAAVVVDCTGATIWSATLSGDGHRLRPQDASLTVEASAHDDLTGRTVVTTVKGPTMIEVSAPGR
jgi:hypothetical protein